MNLALRLDAVHIITIDTRDLRAFSSVAFLDKGERARAYRFRRERDRQRFIVAHVYTRAILGHALHIAPEAIQFVVGPYGKPRVVGTLVDIRFNLSHSGAYALLAVALGREVGIDVEELNQIDALEVATQVFSPAERVALVEMPSEKRLDTFYRGWTRKESFIKAIGDGFSFPLRELDVGLQPHGKPMLIACRTAHQELRHWTMASVPVAPGYAASLTVEGSGWSPVYSAASDVFD